MENPYTTKSVVFRFLRGALAGAISSMAVMNFQGVNTFADLKTFLSSLALSAMIGAISGGILAVDKLIRS